MRRTLARYGRMKRRCVNCGIEELVMSPEDMMLEVSSQVERLNGALGQLSKNVENYKDMATQAQLRLEKYLDGLEKRIDNLDGLVRTLTNGFITQKKMMEMYHGKTPEGAKEGQDKAHGAEDQSNPGETDGQHDAGPVPDGGEKGVEQGPSSQGPGQHDSEVQRRGSEEVQPNPSSGSRRSKKRGNHKGLRWGK